MSTCVSRVIPKHKFVTISLRSDLNACIFRISSVAVEIHQIDAQFVCVEFRYFVNYFIAWLKCKTSSKIMTLLYTPPPTHHIHKPVDTKGSDPNRPLISLMTPPNHLSPKTRSGLSPQDPGM